MEKEVTRVDKHSDINIIVAMDKHGAIGKNGGLPNWKLRRDMRHFKETTTSKVVVMGRKTYFSIPKKFRPLGGRKENIVLTRDTKLFISGCSVLCHPMHVPCLYRNEELWILGGGEIYNIFLPSAKRLMVTHVDTTVFGADTFFPLIDRHIWKPNELFRQEVDTNNQFSFRVVEYTK